MKRLIGYDNDSEDHNADTLRHYLYGGHVADYMRHMMEEDEEKYKSHFSRFIKEGITADGVSQLTNHSRSVSNILSCVLFLARADVQGRSCKDKGGPSFH